MSMTVGELKVILSLDDSQFTRGLDQARGKMDQAGNRLGQVGQKMAGAGRAMTMGVTLPLLAVAAGSVMASAKFETSMNQVQAASGASAGELAGLTKYAKEMGAATVFSAGEAGAAMLELAKSGMTPAQIQGGALKATMDLAAAGGMELADAANVTSQAMHSFGLSADNTTAIAAALAGGANASTAEVSDLAIGLSQVGPGAKNAGLSLQETVAVLAAFTDKGMQGSDAGTSLKTMLVNLVPQTDKAAGMMKKLGLSFVDSKGNIDDISTVAEKLQQKLGGLTQAQKIQAMQTMFGSDATRAATILMDDGAEGLQKYIDATNDQNAATKMAEARMKGMGGALENLKGSLETAGIAIGDVLAPGIKVAAGGIKALADGFTGMPKWAQQAAVGLGTFLIALGPVLIVAGKLATALNAIREFRMARQGLSAVTDVLGKGGGVAGNVPLQTAMGLNTAATEANTLALGGKMIPGTPTANPLGPAGPTAGGGLLSKIKGPFSWLGLGSMAFMSAGNTAMEVKLSDADIARMRERAMSAGWQTGTAFVNGFDGASIARSLRASGDKAGAGLAAGLAHGVGPALQSIQRVHNAAGKPIHMGNLDATQMLNEIGKLSRAFGDVRSAARTAGSAAANAIRSPSGGGGSYRGHFMATGGWVPPRPGGTQVVLGEGGEGETVIPDSKMGSGGDTHFHFHVGQIIGTDERAARQLWAAVKPIAMSEMRMKGAMSRG